MKRSVVLVLLITVVLLGGAAFLYPRLFEADPAPTVVVATTPDAGPAKVPGPSADAGSADAGAADANQAKVITVSGTVQRRNGDVWEDVVDGQPLHVDDAIRTGRNSEARLKVGRGVEVRLSPRSEFSIREIANGVSRVRLEVGHVSASVDESGKQVLKVEAKGSDAVVETKGGTFGMVSDGRGQVAVATTTGSVNFTSKGKTVEVGAGTRSSVALGAAPTAPVAVPKSLLLKVAPPVRRHINKTTTTVQGQTEPGSLVRVDDVVAPVDAKGRFKVKVPLKDGVNKIAVTVTGASGRTKDHTLADVVVDRVKPKIKAKMKWGQGN